MKEIIVIGAGLGGLAAACRLARDGFKVTVVERNEAAGGKVSVVETAGYRFDTGASLVTMKHVFEDLFEYCGKQIDDYLDFVPLDPICRYVWSDGTSLDAFADVESTKAGIEKISVADADRFESYLADSKQKYEIAERTFLSKSLNDLPKLLTPRNIPDLFRMSSLSTLAKHNARHFASPKLQQLFNRYATYNGSSPYSSPATFALIPYVEFGLGAWYPLGGIYEIPKKICGLARELDVEFRFGEEVQEIVVHNGRARGVRLKEGNLEADAIVANADAVSAYKDLIRPGFRRIYDDVKLGKIEPSCSGFVLLLGIDRKIESLAHHNIFFSDDYKAEFEAIFEKETMPADPTVYVCATSRTDPSQAPEGCENLFVLVNAPYTGKVDWEREKLKVAERIISRLEERGLKGLRESIVFREIITPSDFETRYRANKGSIYGISSNGILSAFMRIPNKAKDIGGLFFAGGTTHPGGGMPLVLLSGKMAAEMVGREMSETA